MKFSLKCLIAAAAISQTGAFQAPHVHTARPFTKLSVTTLEDWQLLDNGSVVGSVRGHPELNDGDVITTSPLANPRDASAASRVATMTGSEYLLGNPMPRQAAVAEGTLTRGAVIRGAGIAALTAGGFALGLVSGGSLGGIAGGPQMTVPEAKIAVAFPGAKNNAALLKLIAGELTDFGYGAKNTLVATSLCCDEVNRPLEKALASAYDEPFVMGGLAGFPFGGVTSFGAMAHHIPDGGNCLVVYGPHVGVDQYGSVGTVNRRGRAKGGACCGSAAAALAKIRKGAMVPPGEAKATLPATDSLDAQQAYVDSQLAPYGERLLNADDRNVDLPYALYDAQKKMMDSIVAKGAGAIEGDGNIAILGGIQINTPEGISDYFLPLSFELRDKTGKTVKNFMEEKSA
mmetsp:Transcript_42127/g.121694  ORF Transcript_42127/g.121694 Transcript_42127/m.121694 type:complete len:402 (+) Transcript_42127:122-1327(+)|eukprot:CAMPEP_0176062250 /NCGR_PEP_ID=MMETSP0120_2-20121206/31041_1 /TAXON_ID=160619 /ORGANISM="Kryptoperidinium foliaceum, Strain CCMP 1326" /LENGTH=401 /DNA_ID=CAMNT_0017395815 /DNA_START=108 /DNA_END=1313 /DNA_ORIENTATION=+